ncbi:MAG: family 20 glycosylhydrolase, partial [Actinomycetaceae bacterium]|nr:family 20 glycosylhydrolase [Actinomycetaceae bacterium]
MVVDGRDGGPQRDQGSVHLANEASRWSAPNQDDIWLNIDLGVRAEVSNVEITWGKQWSTDYDIWLSLDGRDWNKVKTGLVGERSAKQTVDVRVADKPVEARHVRLVSHKRSGQYATSIWEIGVFGVALEKPAPKPVLPPLVPLPKEYSLTEADSFFTLSAQSQIVAAPNAQVEANLLASKLRKSTGFALPVVSASTDNVPDLMLVNKDLPGLSGTAAERYTLTVTDKGVALTGDTAHGLFNGTQTLLQLFGGWSHFAQPTTGLWKIPALQIDDQPRFAHRGNMFDPSRSFHTVAEMKQAIDVYSSFKINVLHVHLADDQGWRIEITNEGKHPEDKIDYSLLTSISGKTAMGEGKSRFNRPAGKTGFYTQAEWKEIVAYARAHHMEVIPEIDLPGHTNAALHAIPQLNTPGSSHDGTRTASNQLITDPTKYVTAPAQDTGDVGGTYLDIDDPATLRFIDHVITQVNDLTGSKYFHFGGDEAHALTNKDRGATYRRYVEKIAQIVRSKGVTPITWNEAAAAKQQPGDVVQQWNGGYAAINHSVRVEGAKAIFSNAGNLYYPQSSDTGVAGATWACGGSCRLANWYNYDPARALGLSDNEVLGIEGAQWNEHVRSMQDGFFMQFPRALAAAEVGWTPQAKREGQLLDFKRRAGALVNGLTAQGVDFYHGDGLNPVVSLVGAAVPKPVAANAVVGYLFSPATATEQVTGGQITWDNGKTSSLTVSQARPYLAGSSANHENRQQNGIFELRLVGEIPQGVSEGALSISVNGQDVSGQSQVRLVVASAPQPTPQP